jgi:hypothetical protein
VKNGGGKHAAELARTLSVALLLAERVPFTVGALVPDYVVKACDYLAGTGLPLSTTHKD